MNFSSIARLVRYLVDRERTYVLPSLSNPTPLVVSSGEAQSDLGLSDDEVARAYGLLTTFEWRSLGSGGGNPAQWQFEVNVEEVRHYRAVETPDDYLAARAAAERAQRPSLAPLPVDALEPYVASGADDDEQVAGAGEHRRLRVLAPLLQHPIVATVVGGLILALVLWAVGLR